MNAILAASANEILTTLAVGIAGYLAVLARSFVKAQIAKTASFLDAAARDRLEKAFNTAIDAAQAAGSTVTVNDIIGYVQRMNPGDLERFKLRGGKLVERIEMAIAARVGKATTGAVLSGLAKR